MGGKRRTKKRGDWEENERDTLLFISPAAGVHNIDFGPQIVDYFKIVRMNRDKRGLLAP